ncbi:DUF1573 domain-containing protein [Aquisphaera insulae]|uniref:DUF1573 domain-containing protein n=1 Tax=Aquisphaera insulae TaxID=2712864 RepID=UPI0013EA0FDB|nr:DUF1573 domain-containing protein [Aquisphaera insulae]
MRRILLCGIVAVAVLGQAARGQGLDWVNAALPERAYDFGTVARGSQIVHRFPIVNRTDQELRIVDWRTKCGCTNVSVGAKLIPPGTQTTIEATIDTTKFVGYKPSGLTVIFDRPSFVEVELNLTCFIRGDLVTSPGQLDFGIVRRSDQMAPASLTITYAGGQPGWAVTKMKTQTSKVKAELRDLGRTAEGYSSYSLTATLQPGVDNGFLKDEITLITNDPNMQTIPISVVANVQSAVAVTPSIINFGGVKPGQSVTKTVLVKSAQAFSITKMAADEGGLETREAAEGAKASHLVTLTFKAPEQPGPYHSVLTIETDMKDEPAAKLKTFATVVP